MRKTAFGGLLFYIATAGFGQGQEPLCPRHIETPDYPPIARTAHLAGMVTLTATIDADGKVEHVEAKTDDSALRAHPLLQKLAAENLQHWTFAKPSSALYTQVISYDYKIDMTLPPSGGPSSLPSITKVTFDLPDHVIIMTNARIIDAD